MVEREHATLQNIESLAFRGAFRAALFCTLIGTCGGAIYWYDNAPMRTDLLVPLIVRAYTLVQISGLLFGAIANAGVAITRWIPRILFVSGLMMLVGAMAGVFGVTQIATMTIPYPGSPSLVICIALAGIMFAWLSTTGRNVTLRLLACAIPVFAIAFMAVLIAITFGRILEFAALASAAQHVGLTALGAIAGGIGGLVCAICSWGAAVCERLLQAFFRLVSSRLRNQVRLP